MDKGVSMTEEIKEIEELKSEIDLMKKVIIALADITVNAGVNCTYFARNELYNLISKMKKE